MPRDSSGNYTLPIGNPVVDFTTIQTSWANPTMSDIATQLNNVVTRDGLLQPLAPLREVDGTAAIPAYSFAIAPTYGMYYETNTLNLSANGFDSLKITGTTQTFLVGGSVRGQFRTAPGFHIGDTAIDASSSGVGLYNRPRLVSANTQQYGINDNTMFTSSATLATYGFNGQSRFEDGSYTVATHYGMRIQAPVLGVGMILTANTGLLIQNSTVANSVTGLEIATSAGVNKRALYVSGSADSVFNGNVSAANLLSGTYTPSGTASINCSAITTSLAQYMRVGSVVTVSGRVDLTVTTISLNTQFRLSLPITSNIATGANLGGTAACVNSTADFAASISGDAVNNEALFRFIPNLSGAAQLAFSFTYQIL